MFISHIGCQICSNRKPSRSTKNKNKNMNALPVELISRILLLGCEGLHENSTDNALMRQLITTSAVNSVWRSTALSTQKLWASIHVHPRGNLTMMNSLALMTMQLERSHSVYIDLALHAFKINNTNLALFWETILKHLHRCRSLKIYAQPARPSLIVPFRADMNRLERLEICSVSVRCLSLSFVAPKYSFLRERNRI